ncbi:hypothetical protein A5662_06170 [Mycobacteriaceae bacterium 1482268.1]|nr:hypothetical protein A5662_06170 [Mycobacteriaceae bacterium 1482268.1]
MGRSGTSALTRILSMCGGVLPGALRGADSHNPRGYWEPRETLNLNESILRRHGTAAFDPSPRVLEDTAFGAEENAACIAEIKTFLVSLPAAPLVVIKDPHITVLSGMWFEAARLAGFDVATAIALRHPQEVVASLVAAGPMSPELSSAVWLKACLLAERHSRGCPRVVVDYTSLLDDWRREVARISKALAIDLDTRDEGAIDEFLSSDLRRQRHCGPVTDRFGTDWMSTVYETLSAAARDEPLDMSAMDRVFEAYRDCERDFRVTFDNFHSLLDIGGNLLYTNNVLLRLKRLAVGVAAMAQRRKVSQAAVGA